MEQDKRRILIRIPLTMLGMLLMQTAMVLIWATQLDARVNGMEQQVGNSRGVNEKLARLEERLDDVRQGTADIKRQVEQLTQKLLRQ